MLIIKYDMHKKLFNIRLVQYGAPEEEQNIRYSDLFCFCVNSNSTLLHK